MPEAPLARYMLDQLSNFIPQIKRLAFALFSYNDYINNLIYMINHYDLNIADYDRAIANTNYQNIVKFLLRRYPGNIDDLNKIFSDDRGFYTTKQILAILFAHGVDNYAGIFSNMVFRITHRQGTNTYDDVKWLLSNYGYSIPTQNINLAQFIIMK